MKIDNELIAEFMGWRIEGEPEFKAPYEIWISESGARMYPRTDPNGNKYPEEFKFHTSWDWLMPVVEKFNMLDYAIFNYNVSAMSGLRKQQEILQALSIITPIDQVYKYLVDAIKWHNNQTK